MRASFAPRVLGRRLGPFAWAVEASWRNGSTCRTACVDRVPDGGAFTSALSVLAQPRCFAAAARDPRRPCRNQALRATVHPKPSAAHVWPNSPCRRGAFARPGAVFDPCEFGVSGSQSRATVALIGDSHAVHWRGALEVVAQAKRWRGVSIARPGCPFSTQIPASPALDPRACAELHRQTLAWLRAHSYVHTIFVSSWAQPPRGPQGGTGGYGGDPAAFGALLDMVPATVRRIYVLRDVPATTAIATACVEVRRRAGRPLRNACATPRSAALTPDPGAAAAALRGPRVRAIDLTRHFCGPSRCYPVIGGAYVHKDDNHMNAVFSASLGPFLLRALRRRA